MERRQYSRKKMKKRCAIPQKKLNELESILHQALSLLTLPKNNDHDHETIHTRRVLLLCDEIDQKSFFLHRLLKAEISSCPSPPTQEGHLIYIQNCFERLHQAYHEWTENSDLTLLEDLGSKVGPEPECTASCFNTDEEEEEEEEEDRDNIGELTESIISSTQMSDNPQMELEEEEEEEYFEDVVVPAVEMVSVGVQTDEIEEMRETNFLWNEKPVAEEFFEDEVEAGTEEEEEEEDEEVVLVQSMETEEKRKKRVVVGGNRVGMAKGVVLMGSAMMMGFMIGRFYYTFLHPASATTYSNGCFDYYYSSIGVGGGRHHLFNMLPT